MQLGENELIESLLDLRRGDEFKQDGRRSKRIEKSGKARIQLDGVGSVTSARIRNYSSRGVCLLYTAKLAIGQQFVLMLARNEQTSMRILCTVVHCRGLAGGEVFAVGAEFTLVLGEEKNSPAPATVERHPAERALAELERIRSSILS